MKNVRIKTLSHFDQSLSLPRYETLQAAGADIRACFEDRGELVIEPGKRVLIPTGLAFEIPSGHEIQVRPRSGMSLKTPLLVVNSPGTIDADYRGEVMVIMGNFGSESYTIKHGERIAQLVFSPILQACFELAHELNKSERGEGGFGSTGVK